MSDHAHRHTFSRGCAADFVYSFVVFFIPGGISAVTYPIAPIAAIFVTEQNVVRVMPQSFQRSFSSDFTNLTYFLQDAKKPQNACFRSLRKNGLN